MRRETDAVFSPCRKWRYRLWRWWDRTLPHATFLMMNPSTADEVENDPTVERCELRAGKWQEMWTTRGGWIVGGIEVVNVFAWRETDSLLLAKRVQEGIDIIGPDNNAAIIDACRGAAVVVCGWGAVGHHLLNRGNQVRCMLRNNGIKAHAFKINADGSPRHPLYIPYRLIPTPYDC